MENAIITIILILIVGMAVYGTVHRIKYGSSCCGSHGAVDKRIKVKDRNEKHYPYIYVLRVDGMHCGNCAMRIENAFNSTEGRWAKVDLGKKTVMLISKQRETEDAVRSIVSSVGYTLLSYKALN
ncbi:MAG: heavy-metal-associated domain-containing protein [Lachnospiraceae bacterium]|nr:heavy-metal-associated domain-containing protein [Lachnospiraceae bacterium]